MFPGPKSSIRREPSVLSIHIAGIPRFPRFLFPRFLIYCGLSFYPLNYYVTLIYVVFSSAFLSLNANILPWICKFVNLNFCFEYEMKRNCCKELFTNRYIWQNFCLHFLHLVNRFYAVIHKTQQNVNKSFAMCNGRWTVLKLT